MICEGQEWYYFRWEYSDTCNELDKITFYTGILQQDKTHCHQSFNVFPKASVL